MKLETESIGHDYKGRPLPLCSFDISKDLIVTGSFEGEIKVWNKKGRLLKTYKRHKGCVMKVKFYKDYLVSAGDDGFILFYEEDNLVKSISHKHDIVTFEIKNDVLVFSDIVGTVFVYENFELKKKFKEHNESVYGINFLERHILTYSLNRFCLFEYGVSLTKAVSFENINTTMYSGAKISVSPDNFLIAIGLQYNNQMNSVEIYDRHLRRLFSLIGHSAPCEILSFCPKILKKNKEIYFLIAVASQDKSLSFWTTLSCKPFLLIKNFFESHCTDMKWDGIHLYLSTFDGVLKTVKFTHEELGPEVSMENEDPYFTFSSINLKIDSILDKRRLDITEKYDKVILPVFSINGEVLEEFIDKKSDFEPILSSSNKSANLEDKIIQNLTIKDVVETSSKNLTGNVKKKKIVPVCIDDSSKNEHKKVVLYDYKPKDLLELTFTEPFQSDIGIYKIILKEDSTSITILRNGVFFYKINGNIKKVAYNNDFLVIYTEYLQIYDLKTGILLFPFICVDLSFIDLSKECLLLLDCQGDFKVINLLTKSIISDKLPSPGKLSRIFLSEEYFLVCEYDKEKFFYKNSLWFSINPLLGSILDVHNNQCDFDYDQTINELDNLLEVAKLTNGDVEYVLFRYVGMAIRNKSVDDSLILKIEKTFELVSLEARRNVISYLNNNLNLQYLAIKLAEKISS